MKENKRFAYIIWFLVVIGLFYVVGKTFYQSYLVQKEVDNLKVTIVEMEQSNKELAEKIIYYQSPSYREKIARERMGLMKPGEEVVVILPEEKPKVVEADPEAGIPNYQKWWNFFFKG